MEVSARENQHVRYCYYSFRLPIPCQYQLQVLVLLSPAASGRLLKQFIPKLELIPLSRVLHAGYWVRKACHIVLACCS